MVIQEQDWAEWKQHPVTVRFYKFLEALREEVKENWAQSAYTSESGDETFQRNSYAIGQVETLDELKKASFEDIERALNEEH